MGLVDGSVSLVMSREAPRFAFVWWAGGLSIDIVEGFERRG